MVKKTSMNFSNDPIEEQPEDNNDKLPPFITHM